MSCEFCDLSAGVTPTYHATESVEEAKAVVEQCMSETERLRRMLDDRGVEWRNNDTIRWASEPHERSTIFDDANGNQVIVTQALSGNLAMSGRVGLTPEQAIEATLGRDQPIVRCCDCEYFDTRKCKSQWPFRLDGFCAWGERRADA